MSSYQNIQMIKCLIAKMFKTSKQQIGKKSNIKTPVATVNSKLLIYIGIKNYYKRYLAHRKKPTKCELDSRKNSSVPLFLLYGSLPKYFL